MTSTSELRELFKKNIVMDIDDLQKQNLKLKNNSTSTFERNRIYYKL